MGTNAGIFWDRNNGEGEQKIYDANLSTVSYQAPNGSAWKVSKASFKISENLLFGENLRMFGLRNQFPLLGCRWKYHDCQELNRLSISNPSPFAGGTLTDGYDAYYANDPTKGLQMGSGILGGLVEVRDPGRVRVLDPREPGESQVVVVPMREKVGVVLLVPRG